MTKQPGKSKKQVRTLRQSTEDKAKPKRRSLKAPVRKVAGPLGAVRTKVSSSFLGKIGRFLVPKYFRNSWRELRQVSWPNARQTARLTTAVIIFAVIFGILIAIVDYGLGELFRALFLN